jgi:hypothetical protein
MNWLAESTFSVVQQILTVDGTRLKRSALINYVYCRHVFILKFLRETMLRKVSNRFQRPKQNTSTLAGQIRATAFLMIPSYNLRNHNSKVMRPDDVAIAL